MITLINRVQFRFLFIRSALFFIFTGCCHLLLTLVLFFLLVRLVLGAILIIVIFLAICLIILRILFGL